jgi:UDP-glucose 4-epimerase
MITHSIDEAKEPKRIVVIGASGFVGGAIASLAETKGIETLRLGSAEINLLDDEASEKLIELTHQNDVVVTAAAKAPVKSPEMLADNLRMVSTMCKAFGENGRAVSHVVNISSDAVYSDKSEPLAEDSVKAPDNLHGVMHLAREIALESSIKVPLCTIRPTLIYGNNDPHNGYGPNQFCRLVRNSEDIVLFGDGEEERDHISIEDVARIALEVILRRSTGHLNAATGHVVSFRALADAILAESNTPSQIVSKPRNGPMPHNGYRPISMAAFDLAFPSMKLTEPMTGVKQMAREAFAQHSND